jgi:hypothetical protein
MLTGTHPPTRVAAPARKQKAQGGPSNDPTATSTATPGSDLADRALQGVAKKLSNDLSVEYTVNELMREAMDPYNLASIFAGGCVNVSDAWTVLMSCKRSVRLAAMAMTGGTI